MRAAAFSLMSCVFLLPCAMCELIQIHQDFSEDPGWIGFQNRMVCVDCPTVEQDFGWRKEAKISGAPGEIGGKVCNSRVQAFYAMPIGKPLTFQDRFSASGKLAVTGLGLRGAAYIGFFNSERHEWRPYSSLAMRVWEEDNLGQIMVDWMDANWSAGGFDTDIFVPTDGTVIDWSLEYDPDAIIDTHWEYPKMKEYMTDSPGNSPSSLELQLEQNLYEKAKKDEPGLTAEEFRSRLEKLRDQGLVGYFHRHGIHRWWVTTNHDQHQGKITFKVGDRRNYVVFIEKRVRNAPVKLDRFGIFNIQRYGTFVDMHVADLMVNGQKIDLSQDPHWEGKNNRASWTEPAFQSMHDFGYSQTNWAGKSPGEIGGLFWRTEPPDPHFAYYADDAGNLTLENPIELSGKICFITGMTDAAMYFGYFSEKEQTLPVLEGSDAGFPRPNSLAIAVADSSAIGYRLTAFLTSSGGHHVGVEGPVFVPNRQIHSLSLKYDPGANGGVGRVVFAVDDQEYPFDLTPELRKEGAVFDRVGLANLRRGGNSVDVFFDDWSYTVNREPGAQPVFHKQETTPVHYPFENAGRKY